ncbi:hypothetical protein D1872_194520 [compost metagenome]
MPFVGAYWWSRDTAWLPFPYVWSSLGPDRTAHAQIVHPRLSRLLCRLESTFADHSPANIPSNMKRLLLHLELPATQYTDCMESPGRASVLYALRLQNKPQTLHPLPTPHTSHPLGCGESSRQSNNPHPRSAKSPRASTHPGINQIRRPCPYE